MSRKTRELKRKRKNQRNLLLLGLAIIIGILVLIGYYRSHENKLLKQEDFISTQNNKLYLIKDSKFINLDNFNIEDLNFPEGTKVSGYDILTTSPMVINQQFLDNRIESLETLLNNKVYQNWDSYAQELNKVLGESSLLNSSKLEYFKQTACYAPAPQSKLEKKLTTFQNINTGSPIEMTLTTFGIQDTGFIFSNISEYEQLANEAVLGDINRSLINSIDRLDTKGSTALKIVNSDHIYAITSVKDSTFIQDEGKVLELKDQYGKGLNNSSYYNMLISRVDRLRLYPELSFDYNGQIIPCYLVNVIVDGNQKILVLLIKDYLSNLAANTIIDVGLNTQNIRAYRVPQSAIIRRDDKTYIQIVRKGYFINEVEVHITSMNGNEAILSVADNPDLNNGASYKVYP